MTKTKPTSQTTISKSVVYEGPGLHTGESCKITLLPAPPGSKVCFERLKSGSLYKVPAIPENIVDSRRATDLGCNGIIIHTVEHIMAAILWSGVDNIIIRMEGAELPAGDGSALTYVNLLNEAGLSYLNISRCKLGVNRPLMVSENNKYLMALPYKGTRITFLFLHKDPNSKLSPQRHEYFDIEITPTTFKKEISPARTIGFEWEIENIQKQGLALGVTYNEVALIGKNGYIGFTRFQDEACRHKILDLLGDIAILGRLEGHFIGIGSGHAMNHKLTRLVASCMKTKGRGI